MCLNKFEVLGSQNMKNIEYHVHIRSTDHFKQIGVREKNDRNDIKRLEYRL